MTTKSKTTAALIGLGMIGGGYLWGQATKDDPGAVVTPVAAYADQLVGVVHTATNTGGKIIGEGANVLSATGKAAGGAANSVTATTGVPAAPQADK